jgi:hypothetical protein
MRLPISLLLILSFLLSSSTLYLEQKIFHIFDVFIAPITIAP